MKIRNYLLTLLVTLSVPGGAPYAKGGGFVPDSFDFRGTVDYIDLANGTVVVDDSVYHISKGTRLHGKKIKGNSVSDLEIGQYVGFDVEASGSGQPYLYEIWVLSRDWRVRHPVKED